MYLVHHKFISVGKLQIHTKILGQGPAIVLFHPSPHSSSMMLPLANELASKHTVICVDTPGYGLSDALDNPPKSIEDYTEVFHELFTILKLEKVTLYGSATGAQIAIRYALNYPEKVCHLFLDNAAHFEDDFRNEILKHYFPDLKPTNSGSHLTVLWDMAHKITQYFPWCFNTSEYKLNRPPLPLNIIQYIAIEFLKAGEHYHYAYKAAFMHENVRHVQQLKPNTTIFRWEGSIILEYIDVLLSFDLPDHIQSVSISEDTIKRKQEMAAFICTKASESVVYGVADIGSEIGEENNLKFQFKLSKTPPIIAEDGSHLLKAWSAIKKQNTDITPEEIQVHLIDWYS